MRQHKLSITPRRIFNPESYEDITELKYFLDNRRWKGTCPFYIEDPWEDIPSMCKDKFTRYMINMYEV